MVTRESRLTVTPQIARAEQIVKAEAAAFKQLPEGVRLGALSWLMDQKAKHIRTFGEDSLYHLVPVSDIMPDPKSVGNAALQLTGGQADRGIQRVSELAAVPLDIFLGVVQDTQPPELSVTVLSQQFLLVAMKQLADAEIEAAMRH